MHEDEKYRLVYSDSRPAKAGAPGTGKARVAMERKGRSGKTVTVIDGLALGDEALRSLLRELQQACGTGGTVKEHHLELQGDFQAKVKPLLAAKGYKV